MSFGWSAGDIVAALKFLHRVGVALKDSGGASSNYQSTSAVLRTLSGTLALLNSLQATPIDPNLALNLKEHCDHIQEPLRAFRCDIEQSFERALGANSMRFKLLAAPRKIQWAIFTTKKIKTLQEQIIGPMAGISIILGQQVCQTTLQMPFEIQAQISQTIDNAINTKIRPLAVESSSEISTSQSSAHEQIDSAVGNQSQMTLEAIASRSYRIQLEQVMNLQSSSSELVVREVRKNCHNTIATIQHQTHEARSQMSRLHQKLDHINVLIDSMEASVRTLSTSQQHTGLETSNPDLQRAVQSFWMVLSGLLGLVRELMRVLFTYFQTKLTFISNLLSPYLVVLYQASVKPLLMFGDHFLFEDAIGRRQWLPCSQFQHWDILYKFLIDRFKNEPGINWVLNGRFIVLNSYNQCQISKNSWKAAVQPKSKVAMAIILEIDAQQGKCPDPYCLGEVIVSTDLNSQLCLVCGKRLSILRESLDINIDTYFETCLETCLETTFLFELPIHDHHDMLSSFPVNGFRLEDCVQNEIRAFKRVTWRQSKYITPESVALSQRIAGNNFAEPPPSRNASSQSADINPPGDLDGNALKKDFTRYEVFKIRKAAPKDPKSHSTWAKALVTRDPISQINIIKRIEELDDKQSKSDKMYSFGRYQQAQMIRILESLDDSEVNPHLKWSLVQLDSISTPIISGRKIDTFETTTILVYVGRCHKGTKMAPIMDATLKPPFIVATPPLDHLNSS